MAAAAPPLTRYDIAWPDPHTRRVLVTIEAEAASGKVTDFRIPAWRPGRYIIQNFAAGISSFEASDATGAPLRWSKPDKDTWRVSNPSKGKITVRYRFFCNTQDAGGFVLTPEVAYLNLFFLMSVDGRLDAPAELTFSSKADDWRVATQLKPTNDPKRYTAPSYHYLIDSPTIVSPTLRTFPFEVMGKKFYAHFQGKWEVPAGEEQPWLEGIKKVIEQQAAVIGALPVEEYHMIYMLFSTPISHAVEHENSFLFAYSDKAAANARSLGLLNSTTAHELWHLWNVKRIRPAALWPYRYDREVPTSLHWFTEGVTNYYTDLTMRRAGLLTDEQYMGLQELLFTALENGHAQTVISSSQASTDSWLAGAGYQDPSTGISFYSLGQRVGLLLDLEIRRRTNQAKSLDDVFRYLYANAYLKGKGVEEDGVQRAAEAVAGSDFAEWFAQYVHGVAPFDYEAVWGPLGLELTSQPRKGMGLRALGILRSEPVAEGGWLIQFIKPQTDAERDGLMTGDLITHIDGRNVSELNMPTFFDSLQIRTDLRVKLVRQGAAIEKTVRYRGESGAKAFKLIVADPKKAEWMKGWLAPKAFVPIAKD